MFVPIRRGDGSGMHPLGKNFLEGTLSVRKAVVFEHGDMILASRDFARSGQGEDRQGLSMPRTAFSAQRVWRSIESLPRAENFE